MNIHAVVRESRIFDARQSLALEMIARGAPLSDTLGLLCHIVQAEAGSPVVASVFVLDAQMRLRVGAAPGLPDHYNQAVDGIGASATVGTCAKAAAIGECVETPDIGNDVGWIGIAHLPLALGLVAAWSMPIKDAAGRVIGTFGTYFTERRRPTEDERDLVAHLCEIASQAIQRG
jgi:GAF domain-containing protein